jgi:HAD superfamily hydrolase (TIGR01509 family)
MIKCVIYDCDGVLFDSLEINKKIYGEMAKNPLTEEELQYCHTHSFPESMKYLKCGDTVPKVDYGVFISQLNLEPHLVDVLQALKLMGIVCAISTSKASVMTYILRHFNLEQYFDMVVTSLDVEHPKPHPESIEKIMNAFQCENDEVVFVGDSNVDAEAAARAGVRFIPYTSNHLEVMNEILAL